MRIPLGAVTAALAAAAFCAPVGAEGLPHFPPTATWYQDISAAPVHSNSASMISTLSALGGFGSGGNMQIDLTGFRVVRAGAGAPTRVIAPHPQGYYDPDCEPVGTAMPVPAGAAIEGQSGLVCNNLSEDCHLLVVQGDTLYEAYRATALDANTIQAQCLAVWRLDIVYPPEGRGEHCTSADAAGFPIAPLLFNADEIAAALANDASGDNVDLGHAIRFILPNPRIATDPMLGGDDGVLYVRPATHAGGPTGLAGTVPYGARLRLRSDFPLTNYVPAARVLLNTFKHYGIVLADGGNIALTAEDDLYTTTSWNSLMIDSHTFFDSSAGTDVTIDDFEVLDTGPRIAETYNCVRSTPTYIFSDDFEEGDVLRWSAAEP